jgi:hypothetical protein
LQTQYPKPLLKELDWQIMLDEEEGLITEMLLLMEVA